MGRAVLSVRYNLRPIETVDYIKLSPSRDNYRK
jgi:hypothetical protein